MPVQNCKSALPHSFARIHGRLCRTLLDTTDAIDVVYLIAEIMIFYLYYTMNALPADNNTAKAEVYFKRVQTFLLYLTYNLFFITYRLKD